MAIDPGTVIATGAAVYDLAVKQGVIDRIRYALKSQNHVLVLGSTGVGKTMFLRSLQIELPKAISYLDRTLAVEKQRLKVTNEPFVFHDTPGEVTLRNERSKAFREHIARGPAGVINVVAYGYHEYRTGSHRAPLEGQDANPQFLERHRAVEIEALREWAALLLDPNVTSWVLTVISKADLWWNDRNDAFDFYQAGGYGEVLAQHKWLTHGVVEYCSVLHKFYDTGRLSGLFDDADRVRARANTIHKMLTLVDSG